MALRTTALLLAFRQRLRVFEIFLCGAERQKIGQCAVMAGRHGGVFMDRLLLLEAHAPLWTEAVQAVLAQLGPGRHLYGWELSLEPGRESDLAAIPHVKVAHIRPLVVQAIDFSQSADWEAYYRSVSENSRRNAKAARKNMPDLQLRILEGMRAISVIPALIRLRTEQSKRKRLNLFTPRLALSLFGTIVTRPDRVVAFACVNKGKTLAACYGWRSSENFWYLDSGSEPENRGAAWLLLLELIQREYRRIPTGKFVMGYIDYALHDDERSAGLLRSRYACRVTDYATSIVTFDYSPPAQDGPRPACMSRIRQLSAFKTLSAIVRRAVRQRFGLWPILEFRNRVVMAPALPRLSRFENKEVARLAAQLGEIPTANIACVIPTYKRPEGVVASINSILAQERQDFVIMVIDDGAGLPAVLPQDPRVFAVSLSCNSAVLGLVRNVGIRLTKSRYVAFLDDDNTWTPQHLSVAIAALEDGCDLAYTIIRRHTADGKHLDNVGAAWDRKLFSDTRSFVDANSIVVRREGLQLFSRLPRKKETFPKEDWEFVWNMSAKARVRHVPVATVEYLVSDGSYYTSWDLQKGEPIQAAPGPGAKG